MTFKRIFELASPLRNLANSSPVKLLAKAEKICGAYCGWCRSTDKNILCQEFLKKILINNDPAEYEPKDKLLYFNSHKTSLKLTN